MVRIEGIDRVAANLSERAQQIVIEGHSQTDVIKSAMYDLKSLGDVSGIMSFAVTGALSQQQLELTQRLAVKVLAVLGMIDEAKTKGA